MIYVTSLIMGDKKEVPKRDLSSDTENPKQMYVQTAEAHPLNT